MLLHTHSGFRYLVLLAGLVLIGYSVYALVTKREYDGPSPFFRQYDHNRNKVVTLEELNLGPNAGKRSTRNMDADREFMADGPTKAPELTLLDRYDVDKDGRITLEELNGAEVLMARLDKNGDGVLSGREAR